VTRGGRGRPPPVPAEVDPGRRLHAGRRLERFAAIRAHDPGRDGLRELPDVRVVPLHRLIVVPACHSNAVLGLGQFILERHEAPVRRQLGVRLHGNVQEQPQVLGHGRVGPGQLVRRRSRSHGLGHLLPGLRHPGPGLRHLGEGLLLEPRRLVHGGHQVGDEIVAAKQLRLDISPPAIHILIERLDLIVPTPGQGKGEGEQDQK
jgi:hypothetical protein